ncbi:MAG: anthranilate synthase component II [Flavobacterium sp.]
MKILVLDNHDSFVYNIVHYLADINPNNQIYVIKNNEILLEEVDVFDKILLSPGPGLPKDAGIMPALIQKYYKNKSILGICLGHQAIAEAFGGKLKNLEKPLHGVSSMITVLEKDVLFLECPDQFKIGHYHSWVVDIDESISLKNIALDEKNNCMALTHQVFDVKGLQFHPESILTDFGKQILKNWLEN